MNIYVDEKPKNCNNCIFKESFSCNLWWTDNNMKRPKNCPLELIADYEKEQDHRIAVLERAYENTCNYLKLVIALNNMKVNITNFENYFIDQAEKEMKNDNT